MFFSDSSNPTRRVRHLPPKQWWLVFYFCGAVVVQCPLPPHADVLTSSRIGNYISPSFALLRHLSVRQRRISWTAVRRQWTSYLQKSTPVYSYYVCGYVSKKTGQASNPACSSTSEFTDLVSRGLLNHPPKWLLIFGLFCYACFQSNDIRCVNRLMEAFHLIFDTFFDISIIHRALQSITRRFIVTAWSKAWCDAIQKQRRFPLLVLRTSHKKVKLLSWTPRYVHFNCSIFTRISMSFFTCAPHCSLIYCFHSYVDVILKKLET